MRAFDVTDFNDPPGLCNRPKPGAKSGQVLVQIEACGVNFADLLMAKGTYQDTPMPPFTLGMEVCGRIVEADPDGSGPVEGARVAVFGGQGGFAEYGLFPSNRCISVPDTMSAPEAAAFMVAYGTSHLALTRRAQVQPGETVLVLGAAGGVGLTAVEIAKLLGARVIGVARGAEKLASVKRAGADHIIDSDDPDLLDQLKSLGGVDVVYDPVGGDLYKIALRACKREARFITIGFASGDVPQIPANIILVKNITVIGFYWGGYLAFNPAALAESLTELMQWHADGKLHPHISHTFPLAQTGDALEMLRSRRSTGKIVVLPQE